MARRDIGHASGNDSHASPWADTPARPSSRREPGKGTGSGEPKAQWPEGSWWSEQPDGAERGRSSRGPSRRDIKRHEARAKRYRRRAQDPFGARNQPSGGRDDRGDRFEPKPRRPAPRPSAPAPEDVDARLRFGARNTPSDPRRSGPRDDPPGPRARPRPDTRTGYAPRNVQPDPRNGLGPRSTQPEARTDSGPQGGRPGARSGPGPGGAPAAAAATRRRHPAP